MDQPTWTEFYCGTCHTEAAFFGEVPDGYEFECKCPAEEDGIVVGDIRVPMATVRAAQKRVYVHDDPCAEYEIQDGVFVTAADIVGVADAR